MTKDISAARLFAFSILKKIDKGESNSAELMAEAQEKLQAADRSLCHIIVLGTLRTQNLLDRIIGALTNNRKMDREVRVILRLSLFQLRFLDRVPDYAVVNDAVNLTVKSGKASARGLVNAVLRRFLRGDFRHGFADHLDELSVETSHPRWLLEKWVKDFGVDDAEALARANRTVPGLEFRLTPKGLSRGLSDSEEMDAEQVIRLSEEGLIYLQDIGSQLVAETVSLREGDRFLDVCAAPGGKSGIVSMRNPGATVICGDLSLKRAIRMKGIFAKQEAAIPVLVLDASMHVPFADESFDCVLVDAPCTGTGTIRRNPEIPLRITKEEILESASRQRRILEVSSRLVKEGGQLIYSTCSLEVEENEAVSEDFLKAHPEFEKKILSVDANAISKNGFLRTFPHLNGSDGFFVASFLKK